MGQFQNVVSALSQDANAPNINAVNTLHYKKSCAHKPQNRTLLELYLSQYLPIELYIILPWDKR